MKLPVVSIFVRVLGQGLLALTSFIVSFAAAHSMQTDLLALFFVGWTLETMWIAAIRVVLAPALLTVKNRPTLLSVIVHHLPLSLPVAFVIMFIVFRGGMHVPLGILLAATPIFLGTYEVCRTYLGVEARQAVSVADTLMLAVASSLFLALYYASSLDGVTSALLGLLVGSLVAIITSCFRIHAQERHAIVISVYVWARNNWSLIRVGLFEWLVFFAVSMMGVAVLGLIGGPEVLAGVRLAETLLAPLSIATSAIPLLLAPYLSSVANRGDSWPPIVRFVIVLFTCGASVWVAISLVVPLHILELVVGEHGLVARQALIGLAAGALIGGASVTVGFVMKARGCLREIRIVRWIQLLASVPILAVASSSGSVAIAALGMSCHQIMVGSLLLLLERRTRS